MKKQLKSRTFCGLLVMLSLVGGVSAAHSAAEAFALTAGQPCLSCHAELAEQALIHPATEDGESCATLCHPQSNPLLHQFGPRPDPIASLCFECHEDPLSAAVQHPPVVEGDCLFCHNPHQSQQPALLNLPQRELCLQCHDEDAFSGVSVHGPVNNNQCSACHNPHSAGQAKLLRATPPELCWSCHDKELEDTDKVQLPPTKRLFEDEQAQLHPPFAAGDCLDCHQPHAAAQKRLLSAAYAEGFYQQYSAAAYALCLNCHAESTFTEPRTQDATAFRNGDLNLHYRHVNKVKGRSCSVCHSPHGTRQAHTVQQSMTFGTRVLGLSYETTENGGSCSTSCHVKVSYDRLSPVNNPLRTSPRPGEEASPTP